MSGRSGLSGNSGVTYLMALMIVIVMGILLGRAGQTWTAVVEREREEELIFRGLQFQRALQRWHQPSTGEHVATKLTDLKHLVEDPRTPQTVRRLRRLYHDPVSRKEWLLIMDATKGIVGIKPDSDASPIRQDGFPEELKTLAGKQKYRDWEFRYWPPAKASGTGITSTTPGTAVKTIR